MASGEDRRTAALMGVSPYTLRAWLRPRSLFHVRLGCRILIDRRDLASFNGANRIPGQDEVRGSMFYDSPKLATPASEFPASP